MTATRPSDKNFSFDELEGHELLEDDSAVTSGGKAAAVAGGVMLGGLGAIAGAVAGTKKQKKRVENLVLRIDTNDIDYPCVMVTYINKETRADSNEYRKAQSRAQQTMSALNLILKQREQAAQDAPVQQVVLNQAPTPSDMDRLRQLKELLDAGILTEEEFSGEEGPDTGDIARPHVPAPGPAERCQEGLTLRPADSSEAAATHRAWYNLAIAIASRRRHVDDCAHEARRRSGPGPQGHRTVLPDRP